MLLPGEGRLFTIPDLGVHHADPGLRVAPILVFTLGRSAQAKVPESRARPPELSLGARHHRDDRERAWSLTVLVSEGGRN
jgi:hypothetical protein